MSSKEDMIEVEGLVTGVKPNALFEVTLNDEHKIIAHISGRMRKHNINVLLHDKVTVEMTPYDLSKGRITFRHKK